jgi:hypothetical protein
MSHSEVFIAGNSISSSTKRVSLVLTAFDYTKYLLQVKVEIRAYADIKYTCVAQRSIGDYSWDNISIECMRNTTIPEKQREGSSSFDKSTCFVHSNENTEGWRGVKRRRVVKHTSYYGNTKTPRLK